MPRTSFQTKETCVGKILVVDDNESICRLITDFFQDLKGHEVISTQSPEEAVELVRQHDPDLALLDIMMPGMHGVQVLRLLKQVKPTIKAIMITAVDDEDIAREAMKEGALDYVTKPLDLNYLDAQVTFNLAP